MTDNEHDTVSALIAQLINSDFKGGIAGVVVAKEGTVLKYFTFPCALATSNDVRAAFDYAASNMALLLKEELDTEKRSG
jgi:hypothetical protein